MAVTYQTNYNAYPNITITNGGGASGTISGAGAGYTIATGAGVTGSNGMSYTTTWSNPGANFNSSNGKTLMTVPHGEEKVVVTEAATLEVNGTLKINGVNLEERLKTIETVLQIPTRDITMEAKYPKLAELYKQYMHELEKYKTWDRLNGEKNGTA